MAEKEKKHGVKNPNEGVDGKLASNMTGEAIEGNYDYGNITDSDKKVVTEIIDLMRQRGEVPCSMFAEELKTRFQKAPHDFMQTLVPFNEGYTVFNSFCITGRTVSTC